MLNNFCPIPICLDTRLSCHRFFVDGAPCALIAKTKSNQPQEREATVLEVLRSCLMSTYRWEGSCHIICQLGSALDNVDGVKAEF